ncbi:polysaccharide deacetylase family protein [Candidatus Microgenomates bacterium]|nr:polysaccharide deacetylase family protein [Candidatus Microgenomates bacterium]
MPRRSSKLKLTPPKFTIAIILGLLVVLVILWIKRPRETPIYYYPKSSFKIPEDILKERIATYSAISVRIPVVMYHYVENVDRILDPSRAGLAISPQTLESQIKKLKSDGYTFLFVRDVPGILTDPKTIPPKPIVLTFDDGYEDFYLNALPLLKKYNAKATIYVVYNFINKRGNPPYLTADELIKIKDSGLVEIASHTLNHAYLKDLKFETAKKEIFDSKTKLEKLLGTSVPSFAYPYGAFSKESLDLAKAAGYTNAVSVIPGVNQSGDNLYYLYRLRPGFLDNKKYF